MSVESSVKLLDYINKVSKVPIILDGQRFGYEPPQSVVLDDTFFVKDDCVMCGRCCINETTVWTREGMDRIINAKEEQFTIWGLDIFVTEDIMSRIQRKVININGQDREIFVCPQDTHKDAFKVSWPDRSEKDRCHWLFEREGTYRCRVHPVRPVTCGAPHMRFTYAKASRRATLRVMQYGRNWALKCPVVFGKFDEESIAVRIEWLQYLLRASVDLGIETYLPEIIDYLEKGNRRAKIFYLEHKRKLLGT